MLPNLDPLSERVHQLAALTQNLREQNRALRVELAEANNTNRLMRERLDEARTRIEALVHRIPRGDLSDRAPLAEPVNGSHEE